MNTSDVSIIAQDIRQIEILKSIVKLNGAERKKSSHADSNISNSKLLKQLDYNEVVKNLEKTKSLFCVVSPLQNTFKRRKYQKLQVQENLRIVTASRPALTKDDVMIDPAQRTACTDPPSRCLCGCGRQDNHHASRFCSNHRKKHGSRNAKLVDDMLPNMFNFVENPKNKIASQCTRLPSEPRQTSNLSNLKDPQYFSDNKAFCLLKKIRSYCHYVKLKSVRLTLSYLLKLFFITLLLCTSSVSCINTRHYKRIYRGRKATHMNWPVKSGLNPESGYLAYPLTARPDEFRSKWLYPSVVNLASQAHITANATCGYNGPVKYCKLVEHVDRRMARRVRQCSICDAYSPLSVERHPVKNAIDGRGDRWWQSPTIEQGYRFNWVTISLDLRQVFQVAYIIIKAANSPRPGNWILEKSIDGVTWYPWQYFAVSDSECYHAYGLRASGAGAPKYSSDSSVICTSYFSQLIPLENGEIHVSLINGRPSAENPSQELVEFTSARHVRLRMQKIRTLHGDLMTLSRSSAEYADPVVTRRYFYSIKDISIGGMCICYGHASTCPADPDTGLFSCDCEHNTAGSNCEVCASGFNQYEWQPGNNGFQCEACNCHGHSEYCYFDAEVAKNRKSLNIRGEYSGGGVCIGCRENTEGINCERCIDGYYRPLELDPDAANPCFECNCHPLGSIRSSNPEKFLCVKDSSFIDVERNMFPGSCYCKEGYTGVRCDRCSHGYQGLFCKPCLCNVSGSLNKDPCVGECICKKNVGGKNCSKCQPGYYNLQQSNAVGCDSCYCFGVTSKCHSSDLKWSTITTNKNWEVRDRRGRRKSRAHIDGELGEPFVEHSQAAREVGSSMYYWAAPKEYLGNLLSSYGGLLSYYVSYDILQGSRALPIQDADVIIEGNSKTILYNYRGILVEPQIERKVELRLAPTPMDDYGWVEADTYNPINKTDMMSVLRDVRRLLIRAVYSRNNAAIYRIRDVYLNIASSSGEGDPASSVEVCQCPPGYTGNSCEDCQIGYWRSGIYCLPCQCNNHTHICNELNGACENCQDNAMGMHCERCKPGYYGDATWGTARDCQRCACPLPISSNNFSPSCRLERANGEMVCLECPLGYTGKRCETCAEGYFGQPATPGGNCQLCQCNGNSESCDRTSGICQSCRGHTAGDHCERCEAAYYGDAIVRKNCGPCDCHPIGSISRQCDAVTGQCPCTRAVYGRSCNACKNNHYLSAAAKMCVPCDCNAFGSITSQCTSDGACICRTGVEGQFCDSCANGYYGFSISGCKACSCPNTNGNCDSFSGECVCPANTIGVSCSQCMQNYYGLDPHNGCKKCNCSLIGTKATEPCNNITGQCSCNTQYSGLRCDRCSEGYFGYPNCKPCKCSPFGTKASACSGSNTNVCGCSDSGQCDCKDNVVGKRCDQCASGNFGLSENNPLGCTSCYCSDVTDQCTQASYVWGPQISLNVAPVEVIRHLMNRSTEVFFTENAVSFNANPVRLSFRPEPYYWRLPQQFNGDKSLSYGGKLHYTIDYVSEISSGPGLESGASVVLRGGDSPSLTIQYHNDDPATGQVRPYIVPMQEIGWTHLSTNAKVTRAEFTHLLKSIQFFLIKASYGYLIDQSRLSDVYLDVAIPYEPGRGDADTDYPPANGLEKCYCPQGYTGLSCQACSEGYMRVQQGRQIGRCELCQCFNRSDTCAVETGECINCADKFTGKHCERCIDGYYLSGGTCLRCACPGNETNNNFSPTCHADGGDGIDDYTCDACRTGYEGKHCERCADGYYGNPMLPGGFCAKCGCNVAGSLDGLCNKTTGQCHCDIGIQGRICDQCQPRHVITTLGCTECSDECSGSLLNEVEELMNLTSNIDVHNMFPPPWRRLVAAKNLTEQLQKNVSFASESVQSDFAAATLLKTENVSAIQTQVNSLVNQGQSCLEQSNEFRNAVEVTGRVSFKKKQESQLLSNVTQDLSQPITRLLIQLESGASVDIEQMQARVRRWIMIMRGRDMTYHHIAWDELQSANSLLNRVQTNFMKATEEAEMRLRNSQQRLAALYNEVFATLNDTRAKLTSTTNTVDVTNEMNNLTSLYLRQTKGDIERTKNEANITSAILMRSQRALNKGIKLYENARKHTNMVSNEGMLRSSLRNVTKQVNNTSDPSPTRLVMMVKEVVENHKKNLKKRANYVANVYKNISMASINQTEAASRWTKIANTIERANTTTDAAIKKASYAVTKTSNNLGAKANDTLEQVKITLRDVKQEGLTTDGDKALLKVLKNKLRAANSSSMGLQRRHIHILDRLGSANANFLNSQSSPSLKDVQLKVNESNRIIRKVEERVHAAQQKLQDADFALRNSIHNKDMKDNAAKNIAIASSVLQRALTSYEKANMNFKRIERASENLRKNISNIRKLIADSRSTAASIRSVSVSSTGKCAMQYQPPPTSGETNEIILNVQTRVPNNILFYLAKPGEDFIAVEMRNWKVTVMWDLGGGVGYVQNSVLVESVSEGDWYRIEILRQNQQLELTVYRVSDKSGTISRVQARSPGIFSRLDVDSDDLLFVGGIINTTNVHRNILHRTFAGCMGEAFLDEKSIGLWNFKRISNPEDCKGCVASEKIAQTKQKRSEYSYNGQSYTAIKVSQLGYQTRSTRVRVDLQTFSSEGLILYLGSKTLPDLLSLELSNGHIKLGVDLGSGYQYATTKKTYNNGEWIRVLVTRNKNNASLLIQKNKVDQERIFISNKKVTDEEMDLNKNAIMYVGGHPSARVLRKNVTEVWFVGCLRKFYFMKQSLSLKSTGISDVIEDIGVSYSCPAKVTRYIGISEGGYVQLPPINLPAYGSVSMTFNTRESDALLLLATSEKSAKRRRRQSEMQYFSIYLSGGRVKAQIQLGGKNILSISTRYHYYDNGHAHLVTLNRNGANVTLQMNEGKDYASALLTRDSQKSLRTRRLFVGGVPDDYVFPSLVGVRQSLNGCVRNIMTSKLIDFKTAVRAQNSFIGTCPSVLIDASALTLPVSITENSRPSPFKTTISPVTAPLKDGQIVVVVPTRRPDDIYCQSAGHFGVRKSSARFGFSQNSYMQFNLKKTIAKRFTFTLKVRTFGNSGLLLYASQEGRGDFFALKLKDGLPVFQFDNGNGIAEKVGRHSINNGKWHKIRIRRSRRRGWLSVDKHTRKFRSKKGATSMDVTNVLYVGGLPEGYKSAQVGQISQSMDVCIRGLTMNKGISLSPKKAYSSYKVQPCYKSIESGAYFNGSGYVIYDERYRVGPKMVIEMEFRTWRADGILISIMSERKDGLALEMINGSIFFRTDNGAGLFETSFISDELEGGVHPLCDGKWHSLRAEKNMNTLKLTVDNIEFPVARSAASTFSADTKNPLYIGGLPDTGFSPSLLRTNRNFEGCMKNVKLVKRDPEVVVFEEVRERKGVYPSSCPVAKKQTIRS